MWSVGCVCHLLLSGAPLAAAAVTAAPPGLTDEVWTRVSTDGRAFVRALLHPDPAARPTATEALQHRWLTVAPSTSLQTPLAVRRARQQAEAAAALLEGGAQAGTWWATRGGGADGSPASADRGSPPAGLPSAAADDDPMDAEMGDGSSGTSSLRCSAEGASLAAAPAVAVGGDGRALGHERRWADVRRRDVSEPDGGERRLRPVAAREPNAGLGRDGGHRALSRLERRGRGARGVQAAEVRDVGGRPAAVVVARPLRRRLASPQRVEPVGDAPGVGRDDASGRVALDGLPSHTMPDAPPPSITCRRRRNSKIDSSRSVLKNYL